jgi:hypothetical protein
MCAFDDKMRMRVAVSMLPNRQLHGRGKEWIPEANQPLTTCPKSTVQ